MKKLLIAAVLMGAATGFAQAADPPMLPPVVEAPAFDWTGFYVGINGGGSAGSANFDFPPVPSGVDVPLSGWNLGVVAGGAWQSGMFVLGAEGEIGWTNLGGTAPCPNPAFACNVASNWLGDIEIQAGLAVDAALLYLHGGFAALNVTGSETPGGAATQVATGYVVGAGAKVMVTENVSLVGEYSYYNVSTTFTGPSAIDPVTTVINPGFHKFTVGANLHF